MTWSRDRGSFRDPSGFVFFHEGTAYRQVNAAFAAPFRALIQSGLYHELVQDRLLVAHEEVDLRPPDAPPAHAVLRPEQIPFISYPYEWCFSQLKAAALLTLEIQRRAIGRGLVLRDASAYNVQFVGSRPVFIDTLSFGPYEEGRPWVSYRQFCQHFLAPLAMRATVEPSLGELARTYIDGVPLALASRVLPFRTRFRPGLLMHLHLHARSEARLRQGYGETSTKLKERSRGEGAGGRLYVQANGDKPGGMSRTAMLGLIDSLERTVDKLSWTPPPTLWSTYANHLNYTDSAQHHKRRLVAQMLDRIRASSSADTVWDLGANTGTYSRLAAESGARVVSFDGDHAVIEYQFTTSRKAGDDRVLPLVQNLANPSPAIGWNHSERRSLAERGPADVAMALALVHHLAIGGNVPLPAVAAFFRGICRHLIIEFVPKEDSQVERMLAQREDVFPEYTQSGFERAFASLFSVVQSVPIEGTVRTLYLMERR